AASPPSVCSSNQVQKTKAQRKSGKRESGKRKSGKRESGKAETKMEGRRFALSVRSVFPLSCFPAFRFSPPFPPFRFLAFRFSAFRFSSPRFSPHSAHTSTKSAGRKIHSADLCVPQSRPPIQRATGAKRIPAPPMRLSTGHLPCRAPASGRAEPLRDWELFAPGSCDEMG